MNQASFPSSQDDSNPAEYPSRAQQWAGIIIVFIVTLLAIAAPILTGWLTKNIVYTGGVSVSSVTLLLCMWRPLVRFLYKRKEDYHLDMLKIQSGIRRSSSPPTLSQPLKPRKDVSHSKELLQAHGVEDIQDL